MSQGPGGKEPSQRQAEIEAAAEATAVAVHRFLVEINRAVGTLREDLDVATECAVAGRRLRGGWLNRRLRVGDAGPM